MKAAHLTGVGVTPAGEHWSETLLSLARDAAASALADAAGPEPTAVVVGSAFADSLGGQANLGAHVAAALASDLGLDGRTLEAHHVEADGASGAAALRLGELLVRSGVHTDVLVIGVEKMTDLLPSNVDAARARALDARLEQAFGLTPSSAAALLHRRYLHVHALPDDALAAFPALAHGNALGVPHAFLRRAVSPADYARSPAVARPLRILDCAPDCDGAAAVVVSAREGRRANVRIAASSVAHGPPALAARSEPLRLEPAERSAREALAIAGARLRDVDFLELDDAYSIQAALSLEAIGAADRGEAPRLALRGAFARDGALPVCTFGGSKARGSPLGAAGLYRIVEAALQLRGDGGGAQLSRARRALVQSLGGLGATAITHVLE